MYVLSMSSLFGFSNSHLEHYVINIKLVVSYTSLNWKYIISLIIFYGVNNSECVSVFIK